MPRLNISLNSFSRETPPSENFLMGGREVPERILGQMQPGTLPVSPVFPKTSKSEVIIRKNAENGLKFTVSRRRE